MRKHPAFVYRFDDSMKPTKSLVFCRASGKSKTLFQTKEKADAFIRFNAEEILEKTGKAPVRSYYCPFCCAWHVTSKPSQKEGERLDERDNRMLNNLLNADQFKKEIKAIAVKFRSRMEAIDKAIETCDFSLADELIKLSRADLKVMEALSLNPYVVLRPKRQLERRVVLISSLRKS